MSRFKSLRKALENRVLAERFTMPHDEARMKYKLVSNTVKSTRDFERAIGDYYAYHYGQCVCHGGKLPKFKAIQAAKRIIGKAYQDKKQRYAGAVADAKDGVNGGMRQMLDYIADALKNEDIEDYIAEAMDCYAVCDSFTEQRALIQDMFAELGDLLPENIRTRPPEDFVADYLELVRIVVTNTLPNIERFRGMLMAECARDKRGKSCR